MGLSDLLIQAASKREPILRSGETTACRLFHGQADGLEGLVVERFGDVLIVQSFPGHRHAGEAELAAALDTLRRELGARAVYRKVFVPDRAATPSEVASLHNEPQPWLGEAVEPEILAREHGLRFAIHPYEGFSVGLFLEHRDNRQRIRSMAAGRRVLNTFSYTCSFSVAAAAGGAASVSSVDLSRRYLEWGKRNFEMNSVPLDGHLFFCSDVLDFYARAGRQGRRYDLVIVDPPTFARMRRPKRTFVLEAQLDALVAGAVGLLDPGGIIVLATNARQVGLDRLEEAVYEAARGAARGCAIVDRPALPPDFAGDTAYSKSVFVRVD